MLHGPSFICPQIQSVKDGSGSAPLSVTPWVGPKSFSTEWTSQGFRLEIRLGVVATETVCHVPVSVNGRVLCCENMRQYVTRFGTVGPVDVWLG